MIDDDGMISLVPGLGAAALAGRSRIVCSRLPGLRMKVSVIVVAGSSDEGFGNAAR